MQAPSIFVKYLMAELLHLQNFISMVNLYAADTAESEITDIRCHPAERTTIMDKSKLIKMLVALSAIVVIVASVSHLVRGNSMSLTEYAQLNPPSPSASSNSGSQAGSIAASSSGNEEGSAADDQGALTGDSAADGQNPMAESPQNEISQLTGAALNGNSQAEQRISLTEDFYYEPLSDHLRRYITGVSFPATDTEEEAAALAVSYDDLRYVHVLHYDFDGNPVEGELICNEYIAQDLVEIFYELYYNEYQIERMVLIDEYDGDDTASMEDNNTSCFNYRVVEGSDSLSKHAYGLAVDINPFYNPYVTYEKDGTEKVSPVAALGYADRSVNFPYKIDEDDLCCRLFKEHGFIWGGNWNSLKDYQHFQKTPK